MIFGFNTDVKHGETVYHVQSEARENELLLQTQVFVRGRCIGKRATSYADERGTGGFSDQQKEQILRDQHRLVLDSIRDGRLDTVLDKRDTAEALDTIKELDVHWLNADSVHSEQSPGHSCTKVAPGKQNPKVAFGDLRRRKNEKRRGFRPSSLPAVPWS